MGAETEVHSGKVATSAQPVCRPQGAIHTFSNGNNVFVGHCADEEQARRGWEALGSPGDFETYSKALQHLEANQFMFRDAKYGRIDIVVVDAEQLANLAGRRRLGGAS